MRLELVPVLSCALLLAGLYSTFNDVDMDTGRAGANFP